MNHDTQPPQDSRIGPPVEDSRNDLEADLAFREQHERQPRRGNTAGRDSQFQPRRSLSRAAPGRRRMWLAAAAALLLASAFIIWKMRPAPVKLPTLPIESAQVDQPSASGDALPSPVAAASAPKTIRASLEDVYLDVKSTVTFMKALLERQQSQSETLAKLEQHVSTIAAAMTQMKQAQEQQAAAAAAARTQARRVAKAAARTVAAASAPARRQAQLLSVDIWGGQPSVVIGTTDRADVRFLREGDQQAGVTLKQADPRRQRAVFDVAGDVVELARDATN